MVLDAKDDKHFKKAMIAAKYSGVTLSSKRDSAVPSVTSDAGETATASLINPVLMAIASIGPNQRLLGDSPVEKSSCESWLEWTEKNVEESSSVKENVFGVVEKHLTEKTFLVNEGITVADISLAISLEEHLKSHGDKGLDAVRRWCKTCLAQPHFQSVSAAGGSSMFAVAAGSGSTGGSTTYNATVDTQPLIEKYSSCIGGRTKVSRVLLSKDGGESMIGQTITVAGWVRTIRDQANLTFVELNDGSCPGSMQIIAEAKTKGYDGMKGVVNTGASIKCIGTLVKSPAKGQSVEIQAEEIIVLGGVDAEAYPLPNKRHKVEYLREIAHLRPRSKLIGSVARIRSALAHATHEFFKQRGFLYVHTPCITASDCEGAGEMFQVTTVIDSCLKEKAEAGHLPWPKDAQQIDYAKDFFGKKAYLTVSGQLAVENYCCALSDVYTFGPTFRAEDSKTKRHLAEFWMIEPELAFADINDNMQCAEDYLKFCVQFALDNNKTDLEYFDQNIEKGLLKRLDNLLTSKFGRITYTEAVSLLQEEIKKGSFKKYLEANYQDVKKDWPKLLQVAWGDDLNAAHEKYIAEEIYKRPVITYNYPAAMKAFYMRMNEDGKTCAAMDVLAPLVGEVIGGSQREERLDVLDRRIEEMGLEIKDYWWYRDLRKYGSVPHSGFGLGFERLIMLTTGVDNIRDVIPFPRYPGHAEF